jgi:hypothetical protein
MLHLKGRMKGGHTHENTTLSYRIAIFRYRRFSKKTVEIGESAPQFKFQHLEGAHMTYPQDENQNSNLPRKLPLQASNCNASRGRS